jgi:hypothetical protein
MRQLVAPQSMAGPCLDTPTISPPLSAVGDQVVETAVRTAVPG